MIQLANCLNEWSIFLQTVLKNLIVEVPTIIKKMEQIVEVLFVYHYRRSSQEECCIGTAHYYLCSSVGLSLTITHLVSFITEHHAKPMRVLCKIIYKICIFLVSLFVSLIVLVLCLTHTYLLIIDDSAYCFRF